LVRLDDGVNIDQRVGVARAFREFPGALRRIEIRELIGEFQAHPETRPDFRVFHASVDDNLIRLQRSEEFPWSAPLNRYQFN
jgi:hypothetical protein